MKYVKRLAVLAILLIIYIYVAFITLFPDSIILMQGEEFTPISLWGIHIKEVSNIRTSLEEYTLGMEKAKVVGSIPEEEKDNALQANTTGTAKLSMDLFDAIPVKEVSVSVIPKIKVIPLRKCHRFKIVYKWGISGWYDRGRRK